MNNRISCGASLFLLCVSSLAWAAETPSASHHSEHMKTGNMAERQVEISQLGKDVMPFNLAATTHIFTKNEQGGTQKIVTKKPKDDLQVRLARQHLQEIRTKFLNGDFSGPSHIHGPNMPGLDELKAAQAGAIAIDYKAIRGGGQL
ncbi:MAG: aspartate carbamoyltransferase, partial [Alphaproteobacteria bacterium]|nr:aspartate carbamoyltransferase [Alphaproteobacteria bacterium]